MANVETIVIGGGCFWCTEAVYLETRGVVAVESGYSNGKTPRQPTYQDVCTGDTGYVEVVRLQYDPELITLREIFEIFFVIHDPNTLNRQGNDVGTQYRSGIYYRTEAEKAVADEVIAEMVASGVYRSPIVTEVTPLADYWPAEAYHQNYFAQHPNQGYCAAVVGPKVQKFRKTFAAHMKS